MAEPIETKAETRVEPRVARGNPWLDWLKSPEAFWHLLFLDVYLLFLTRGGLSVAGIWRHALFLMAATLLLAWSGKKQRAPRAYLALGGLFLVFCSITLIPLPEAWLPYFAPVKHRVLNHIGEFFPQIAFTTEASMVPSFHRFKLAVLGLDFYLILLGLMAPRPGARVFRFWTGLLALTLGLLAILGGLQLLPEQGFLSRYRDTYGGLVNFNHFGTTMAVLFVFLLSFLSSSLREIIKAYRRSGHVRRKGVTAQFPMAVFWVFCLVVCLAGFQFGWSRSGVINLVAGILLFSFLSLWQTLRLRSRRASRLLQGLVALGLVLLILFMPMGQNLDKFQKGLDPNGRIELWTVGLEYLREGQVLGTGLGSAESILDPVTPKLPRMTVNVREFHNDYLQVLVELGYAGAFCLFLGITLVAKDLFRRLSGTSFSSRLFLNATLTMMFAFALHSLVSFPLRVNAIRCFAYLAILLGLKVRLKRYDSAPKVRVSFWVPALAGVLLTGYWTTTYLKSPELYREDQPEVAFAVKFGRYYRADLYRANQNVARLFQHPNQVPDPEALIQETRVLLYRHLKQNPFSLKALNLLFLLDASEFRAYHPEFKREEFLALKAKAEGIQALGKDRNINARLSLFYLLTLYQPHLNPEEKALYQSLKEPLRYWMTRIEEEL